MVVQPDLREIFEARNLASRMLLEHVHKLGRRDTNAIVYYLPAARTGPISVTHAYCLAHTVIIEIECRARQRYLDQRETVVLEAYLHQGPCAMR